MATSDRQDLNDDPRGNEEQVNPELEHEARDTGWLPKEEYKGDPERWVPADAWLERGRELAPLIKAQNKGLKADLERERTERQRLEAQLRANSAALDELKATQDRSAKDELQDAISEVKEKIKQASEAQDHALLADLTEQLTDLKLSARQAEAAEKARGNGQDKGSGNANQPPANPAFDAWYANNREWYGVDMEKSDLAEFIGKKLARRGLQGATFYQELDKEMAKQSRGNGQDRYASGSTGSSRGGAGLKKGYADMPAEARRECDGFRSQLVGPTKRYKTIEDWRQKYADKYFEQQ